MISTTFSNSNLFVHQPHPNHKNKRKRFNRSKRSTSSTLFSVKIQDALISTSFSIFSCIHIHPSRCPPSVQSFYNDSQFTISNNKSIQKSRYKFTFNNKFLRFIFFPLLFMQKSHVAYSLPGSDYCLVTDFSQNITQQNHHVHNIISQSSGYQSVATPSVSLHSGTRPLETRL